MNDTANAVAPVIYTNSLSPVRSVFLAAIMNFLGVLTWGIGVAMGIMHLLPLDIIVEKSLSFWVVLILSLLFSAIIWNLSVWYLGIPSSSSHALIGSILGVSIAMQYLDPSVIPSWAKAEEVFKSLLISPLIWFGLAFLCMGLLHKIVTSSDFFKRPGWLFNREPKNWIRYLLIGVSGFVSYAHGSNDGQKWVGLAMLILISLVPASFAINPSIDMTEIRTNITHVDSVLNAVDETRFETSEKIVFWETRDHVARLKTLLEQEVLSNTEKVEVRKHILKIQKDYKVMSEQKYAFIPKVQADSFNSAPADLLSLKASIDNISSATDYAPWWILAMISIALGAGTMVGWKRIVTTIWEKIGKEKLNYAQATTGALITAVTIWTATKLWLPVSTTHILSSGIAGTMTFEHGKWWLQWGTIRHILMAWVLTLPVTITLSAGIFLLLWKLFV